MGSRSCELKKIIYPSVTETLVVNNAPTADHIYALHGVTDAVPHMRSIIPSLCFLCHFPVSFFVLLLSVLPPKTRTRPSSAAVTHKLSSAGLPKMLYTKSRNRCESSPSAHIERPDARARRHCSSPKHYAYYNVSI